MAAPRFAFPFRPMVAETNVKGVLRFPRLPDGFNFNVASATRLLRYGFPPRPSRRTSPRQHDAWKLRFPTGLELRTVTPMLQLREKRRRPVYRTRFATDTPSDSQESANWAGCAVGGQIISALATWVIPNIYPSQMWDPSTTSDGFQVSTWVGLGGGGPNSYQNPPVPAILPNCTSLSIWQAGVSQEVAAANGPDCIFWFEWLPNPDASGEPDWAYEQYNVNGLSVQPGNEISVYLLFVTIGDDIPEDNPDVPIEDPDLMFPTESGFYGLVNFINYTTSETVSYLVPEPPDVDPIGQCAEWILERPTLPDGDTATLPLFGDVQFNHPGACVITSVPGALKASADIGSATLIDMFYNLLTNNPTLVAEPQIDQAPDGSFFVRVYYKSS